MAEYSFKTDEGEVVKVSKYSEDRNPRSGKRKKDKTDEWIRVLVFCIFYAPTFTAIINDDVEDSTKILLMITLVSGTYMIAKS